MMNGLEHGWGMGWGWIIGIAVLILVVWLIVRLVSGNTTQRGRAKTSEKSAIDLLKGRYARGEIKKKEFEEKKKDLL